MNHRLSILIALPVLLTACPGKPAAPPAEPGQPGADAAMPVPGPDTSSAAAPAAPSDAPASDRVPYPAPPPLAAALEKSGLKLPDAFDTSLSGLRYRIDEPGKGPLPQTGQTVAVHYTGWLTDGKQFDTSRNKGKPFTFPLGKGRVIDGWDEGVAKMPVGSSGWLIVPPELGYGEGGAGDDIPPNATLIFHVELVGIEEKKTP